MFQPSEGKEEPPDSIWRPAEDGRTTPLHVTGRQHQADCPPISSSDDALRSPVVGSDSQADDPWEAVRNPNVARVLFFCFVNGAAYSIWSSQVYQVLLKQLWGDTTVGWMSAVSGVSQMVAAVVAGFTGDLYSKETVLRVGGGAGLVAVLLTMLGAKQLDKSLLYTSQVFCGIFLGVSATGTEAMFADSVPTGRRAFVYNLKWIDQTLSSSVGLVITLFLLMRMGDVWELESMVNTMYVGLLLHPVAMVTLWTLRERYALTEEVDLLIMDATKPAEHVERDFEEEHSHELMGTATDEVIVRTTRESTFTVRKDAHWQHAREVLVSVEEDVEVGMPTATGTATYVVNDALDRDKQGLRYQDDAYVYDGTVKGPALRQRHYGGGGASSIASSDMLRQVLHYASWAFTWSAVPYLVCLVDFLVSFGSGMTMRFLPLFFISSYDISPSTLMTALLITCPLQAVLSYGVQYLGDHHLGRLPSTMASRLAGTVLLLIMGLVVLPLPVVLPMFVLRNALMNSTRGITRSVIMDCVKKENRAKWSAFESFSSFTWAGSAAIGGYLAEAHGYQFTFTITALFHFCALAMLVPAAIGARHVEKELIRQHHAAAAARRQQVVIL